MPSGLLLVFAAEDAKAVLGGEGGAVGEVLVDNVAPVAAVMGDEVEEFGVLEWWWLVGWNSRGCQGGRVNVLQGLPPPPSTGSCRCGDPGNRTSASSTGHRCGCQPSRQSCSTARRTARRPRGASRPPRASTFPCGSCWRCCSATACGSPCCCAQGGGTRPCAS